MSFNQLYVDFYHHKVHHCPYLNRLFNKTYSENCIREYLQILGSVK